MDAHACCHARPKGDDAHPDSREATAAVASLPRAVRRAQRARRGPQPIMRACFASVAVQIVASEGVFVAQPGASA